MEFNKILFDRDNLHNILDNAIKTKKVIYISAQTGWGKTIALAHWASNKSNITYISDGSLPKTNDKGIFIIDDFQDTSFNNDSFLDIIKNSNIKSQFILISRSLLPYYLRYLQLNGNLEIMNENAFKLSFRDIERYMLTLNNKFTKEEINYVFNACRAYPVAVDCLVQLLLENNSMSKLTIEKGETILFDYFEQAVFNHAKIEEQNFLLKISVFPTFTLELAEMVTGDNSIIKTIENIIKKGKSIVMVQNNNYYIPAIYQQFLLYVRNKKLKASSIKRVWRNAALYYELNNNIPQALDCYYKIKDNEKIQELLIKTANDPPYADYFLDMEKYYSALDEGIISQTPEFMKAMSMIFSMKGDAAKSEYWYDKLVEFSKVSNNKNKLDEYICYLNIALPHRGSKNIAKILLDVAKICKSNSFSINNLSITSGIPSLMHGGKDFCSWSKHDDLFYKFFKKTIEIVLGPQADAMATAGLAESKLEKANLSNLEDVIKYASLSLMFSEKLENISVYFTAVSILIRAYLMNGQLKQSFSMINLLFQKANNSKRILDNVFAFKTKIMLYSDKALEAAEEYIRDYAPDETKAFYLMYRYCYLVKVRCYILTGRTLDALTLLLRLIPYFEEREYTYFSIEANLLLAIVQYRMENNCWETTLDKALKPLEHYNFFRLPAEEGIALLPLLKGKSGVYVDKLYNEVKRYAQLYPLYLQNKENSLHMPTKTESKVLDLLNKGMSNQEISDLLSISLRTVKFHTSNIYSKLNVKNRQHAIIEGRKLFER